MLKKFFGVLMLLIVGNTYADSIYLCKAYSGGMFWASDHCVRHNALIDRIANVPDGLSWDQKVAAAEQQLRGAPAATAPVRAVREPDPNIAKRAECSALDQHIIDLDSMARQPQSAATQDWIRSERKTARDRQFELRCQ
jgi:hypothetical protein